MSKHTKNQEEKRTKKYPNIQTVSNIQTYRKKEKHSKKYPNNKKYKEISKHTKKYEEISKWLRRRKPVLGKYLLLTLAKTNLVVFVWGREGIQDRNLVFLVWGHLGSVCTYVYFFEVKLKQRPLKHCIPASQLTNHSVSATKTWLALTLTDCTFGDTGTHRH